MLAFRRKTVVVALVASLALTAAAGAATSRVDVIRARLTAHDFNKAPLFPASIPYKIECCRVIAGFEGNHRQHYVVSFLGHGRQLEVGFFRLWKRDLRQNLAQVREFDGSIKKLRIHGRPAFRARFRGSELSGPGHGRLTRQLFWHEQSYTYAYSDVSRPPSRVTFDDLIAMARSTGPIH